MLRPVQVVCDYVSIVRRRSARLRVITSSCQHKKKDIISNAFVLLVASPQTLTGLTHRGA
jgi:hypothetical protein